MRLWDDLLAFGLAVIEVSDADEQEIRDLFQRLQEGVPLNPAERRHAMQGGLQDLISSWAGELTATPN